MIPRFTLPRALGLTVLLVLAAVTFGRVTGAAPDSGLPPPEGTPVAARELRFHDRADGAIVILEGEERNVHAIVPPESGYFLRATLRGLARGRRQVDQGAEIPFRLAAWHGGRLTLEDPATNRRVELVAFGSANVDVFARLLDGPAARP